MDKKCELLLGNDPHHSHWEGNFYKLPDKIPFVLHDLNGCIYIDQAAFNEQERLGNFRVSHARQCDKLSVRKGIAYIWGYRICECARACPRANFRKFKGKGDL